MVRTKQLVNVLRIVWILFLLNYEFNIFWFAAKRCTLWNKKVNKKKKPYVL
jgi:hypothetical protein